MVTWSILDKKNFLVFHLSPLHCMQIQSPVILRSSTLRLALIQIPTEEALRGFITKRQTLLSLTISAAHLLNSLASCGEQHMNIMQAQNALIITGLVTERVHTLFS